MTQEHSAYARWNHPVIRIDHQLTELFKIVARVMQDNELLILDIANLSAQVVSNLPRLARRIIGFAVS